MFHNTADLNAKTRIMTLKIIYMKTIISLYPIIPNIVLFYC